MVLDLKKGDIILPPFVDFRKIVLKNVYYPSTKLHIGSKHFRNIRPTTSKTDQTANNECQTLFVSIKLPFKYK